MTANRLLFINAAQLAFRNKPALATNGAQDTTLSDFLAKALEQLLLGLVRAQRNRSQIITSFRRKPYNTLQKNCPADERGSAEHTLKT